MHTVYTVQFVTVFASVLQHVGFKTNNSCEGCHYFTHMLVGWDGVVHYHPGGDYFSVTARDVHFRFFSSLFNRQLTVNQ